LHVLEVAGTDELLALPVLIVGGPHQHALADAEAVAVPDFADVPDFGDEHLFANGPVFGLVPDVVAHGAVDGRHPHALRLGDDRRDGRTRNCWGDDHVNLNTHTTSWAFPTP
jgi:hypothetical protein